MIETRNAQVIPSTGRGIAVRQTRIRGLRGHPDARVQARADHDGPQWAAGR